MSELLVQVDNVSKRFCKDLKRSLRYGVQDIAAELWPWRQSRRMALRPGEFWALRDVSFELRRGEALGIMGPNGAGKSTLLKLLNGLLKPDAGCITLRGRIGALIQLGAGFNPLLTGRENIYVNAAVLGLSTRQTDHIVDQIIDFAGIRPFIDAPVQNYSSGMWVRLGYAIAAHLNPDVLLVDEVLAVGDLTFRRKCMQHMQRYLQRGGALILVSHSAHLLQAICEHSLLIHQGRIACVGPTVEVVNHYVETQHQAELSQSRAGQVGAAPERATAGAALDDEHPLRIETVEIAPLHGDEIRTGDPALITVRYRAIKEIDDVFWGFGVWSGDQWVGIAGETSKFSTAVLRTVKGQGEFRCTLPRLPLIAGVYTLRAFIGDKKTPLHLARLGWEDSPAFFSVQQPADSADNLRALAGVIVQFDVHWEGGGR